MFLVLLCILLLRKSGEISYFTFIRYIVGQYYSEYRVFVCVLRVIFVCLTPQSCIQLDYGTYIRYRHRTTFVAHSDAPLETEYGRSAIGAERHVLIPTTYMQTQASKYSNSKQIVFQCQILLSSCLPPTAVPAPFERGSFEASILMCPLYLFVLLHLLRYQISSTEYMFRGYLPIINTCIYDGE